MDRDRKRGSDFTGRLFFDFLQAIYNLTNGRRGGFGSLLELRIEISIVQNRFA